jgi:hypothetical protein
LKGLRRGCGLATGRAVGRVQLGLQGRVRLMDALRGRGFYGKLGERARNVGMNGLVYDGVADDLRRLLGYRLNSAVRVRVESAESQNVPFLLFFIIQFLFSE